MCMQDVSWNILLFGDSDISRWPPSLHPSPPLVHSKISNYSKGGAELADILHQIDQWKIQIKDGSNIEPPPSTTTRNAAAARDLFLCCVGENDIGGGRSMDQILETFRAVLDGFFPQEKSKHLHNPRMVFLGPKYEPWLTHDNSNRKQYTKLNNGFQRAIRKHHASAQIIYIDCLTMFCTKETATVPGAIYGGKAMPNSEYFDPDGLHLNDAGYRMWKKIVEEKTAEFIDV